MSTLLHFWRLRHPGQVVFDEAWFGRFATDYCCTGRFHFDVHPPGPKLLVGLALKLTPYKGGLPFALIGWGYAPHDPAWFRAVPAAIGTLIPLAFVWLLRRLGASRGAALLGGLTVTLDNSLLLQTRLLMLDGLLVLGTIVAVSSSLQAVHSNSWGWAVLAGIGAAAALGTKLTGLVAPALVTTIFLWHRRWREIAAFIPVVLVLYVGSFAVHFALLDKPGEGFRYLNPTGAFWSDLIALHREMLRANAAVSSEHPLASPWWSWPLMLGPMSYWTNGQQWLIFRGNPALWWGSALGIVLLSARSVQVVAQRRSATLARYGWMSLLFVGSWLPLALVDRALFLYHYLTPLLAAVALSISFADDALKGSARRWASIAAIVLIASGFAAGFSQTFGL